MGPKAGGQLQDGRWIVSPPGTPVLCPRLRGGGEGARGWRRGAGVDVGCGGGEGGGWMRARRGGRVREWGGIAFAFHPPPRRRGASCGTSDGSCRRRGRRYWAPAFAGVEDGCGGGEGLRGWMWGVGVEKVGGGCGRGVAEGCGSGEVLRSHSIHPRVGGGPVAGRRMGRAVAGDADTGPPPSRGWRRFAGVDEGARGGGVPGVGKVGGGRAARGLGFRVGVEGGDE